MGGACAFLPRVVQEWLVSCMCIGLGGVHHVMSGLRAGCCARGCCSRRACAVRTGRSQPQGTPNVPSSVCALPVCEIHRSTLKVAASPTHCPLPPKQNIPRSNRISESTSLAGAKPTLKLIYYVVHKNLRTISPWLIPLWPWPGMSKRCPNTTVSQQWFLQGGWLGQGGRGRMAI